MEHKKHVHEETRVNKSPFPSINLTTREKFQCEECHYKTTAKDVLEKHMKLNHRKDKNKAKKRKKTN